MSENGNERKPGVPKESKADSRLSRRELLASLGAAGLTVAAGSMWQAGAASSSV